MEVSEPENEQILCAFPAGKPTFQLFQITTSHMKQVSQILKHISQEILTHQFNRKVVREGLCLFKSSFVCLLIWLSLIVYGVLSLFTTSIVFKQQTVLENETNSNTTSTDGTVLCARTSNKQGPEGGGGKQGSAEDNQVRRICLRNTSQK